MPIPVKCQTCGLAFRVADANAGKLGKCPKCQQIIQVPPITAAEPPPFNPQASASVKAELPPKATPEPRAARFDAERAKRWIKTAAFWVSLLTFLVTTRSMGASVMSHYVALIVWVSLGAAYLLRRIPQPYHNWMVVATVIGAVWLWGRSDYFIHRWQDTNDLGDKLEYTDYIYRGDYSPFYRTYWCWYKDGSGHYYAKGGFSESKKQHGPWEISTGWTKYETRWYWYGEEITEGEWHLRNR